MRLLRDSIPGHLWAYMLTLVVSPDELLSDPALAVRMARLAATRAPTAPTTDREVGRLRYVYDMAKPGDYLSTAHFEEGYKWLETATKTQ